MRGVLSLSIPSGNRSTVVWSNQVGEGEGDGGRGREEREEGEREKEREREGSLTLQGTSFDQGMVLVVSLWNSTSMGWLDGYPNSYVLPLN